MSLATLMVHTVDGWRVTRTPDGKGGWTETWANHAPGLPCRIQPLSAAEIARYATVEVEVTHRIYFSGVVDVLAADRLTYGTRTFEVKGVRDIDELARLTTVEAKEICP